MVDEYFLVNGKKYERTGKCDRCGGCCIGCPHYEIIKGVHVCKIYDNRTGKYKVCIKWPIHPGDIKFGAKNGKCAFKFVEVKDGK